MHLGFLVPLSTAVVSGYISKKSDDEIAYLTMTLTVVCLLISLVIAPWQIQLLLLVSVLISTKKLLQQNSKKLNIVQPSSLTPKNSDRMAVNTDLPKNNDRDANQKYRGVSYNASQGSVEYTEGEITGKYRGLPWRMHQIGKLNNGESKST